jgi:c-di-GMP-binding flagellar brake protein YcgR
MIPGRLAEESRGGSLQVAVSGRVSRVQRRGDVRARVDLPPVSAVKLGPAGQPVGLLGLHAVDLSAGGIRVTSSEPLRAGDRLRLVLHLDDGQPLGAIVQILIGGLAAQGRFVSMPERDRRRIVQFVYRQELAERRRAEAAELAD